MKTTKLDNYIKQYQQLFDKYCKESKAFEKVLIPLLQEKFPKTLTNKEKALNWITDLTNRPKKEVFKILTNLENSITRIDNVFKD
jgi:hypothetical protein